MKMVTPVNTQSPAADRAANEWFQNSFIMTEL